DKDSTIAPDATTILERVCADLAQREVLVDENGKMHKPSDEHRAPASAPTGKRRRLLDVAGNGRFIRNVIEDAFGEQMYRISDLMDSEEIDDETLTTITADDLSTALT